MFLRYYNLKAGSREVALLRNTFFDPKRNQKTSTQGQEINLKNSVRKKVDKRRTWLCKAYVKTGTFEIHLAVTKPQGITYCSGAYLSKENNSLIIKSVLEWLGAFAWEIQSR